jgi:anti-sigma factor RsiW
MKTPSDIDDDTLQRFYDGDLSPLEEHGVQARIESDPAAQRRLAELGQMTELMRAAADQLGSSVRSAALFAAIEGKLAQPDQTGFGARVRLVASEWLEHRRATVGPIVAATAVAAVTLLAVIKPSDPSLLAPGSASSVTAPSNTLTAAETPGPAIHGSRIEDVDFGASTGTVFELDNQGVAVAVVWITDEETP